MTLYSVVVFTALRVHVVLAAPCLLKFRLRVLFICFEVPAAPASFLLLASIIVEAWCSDHAMPQFPTFLDVMMTISAPGTSLAHGQRNVGVVLAVHESRVNGKNVCICNLLQLWLF